MSKVLIRLPEYHGVMGKSPLSLRLDSLQEVEEYHKNMIKDCGKGGGFIMRMTLPVREKTEDIREMVDTVKEYSRYQAVPTVFF